MCVRAKERESAREKIEREHMCELRARSKSSWKNKDVKKKNLEKVPANELFFDNIR